MEFSVIQLPNRLNRSSTVHEMGYGPRSTEKITTPKSIKGRFNSGAGGVLLQIKCLPPEFIRFNREGCLLAFVSCFLSGKELELSWSVPNRQIVVVNKYISNRILTTNRIKLRDKITNSYSHIK